MPAQQQHQQQQQPGYGMAPQGAMVPQYGGGMAAPGMGGGSVMGVPLQAGERVVYFNKPSYTGDKIAMWILFVFTFWILIGFFFLYQALTMEKKNPKGHVVTTLRVISIPGEGEPISYYLQNVADLEPVRQSAGGGGGGGLLGAAIRAGVTAVANSMADKKSKTERSYWARSIAVVLIDHGGMKHQINTKDAINMGMFIAQGMVSGGFNQCPDVHFEP
jgi:hypothetical protein